MNLASVLTSGGAGAVASAILIAIIEGVFNRGGKRADAARGLAEAAKIKADGIQRDHEQWMTEAKEAYERVETECAKCTKRLNAIQTAFYELLDDLNDVDSTDPARLRGQIREAARKARRRVMELSTE